MSQDDMPTALQGIVPDIGDIWEWEPLKSHARVTLRVTDVKWNGHEAWVEAERVDVAQVVEPVWNELSRWVEAAVLISSADD